MARRPADAVAGARWPQGRPAIWTAIRGFKGAPFTRRELARACELEVPRDTIRSYLAALVAAGIVEIAERPSAPGEAYLYRLARDPGAEAPRLRPDGTEVTQGLGQEALWRTLRRGGAVTAGELALTASTVKAPVSEETAKTYLRYLAAAGLVRIVSDAKSGRGGARRVYAFQRGRDPGPLPPQVQRVKQLFDPNSNSVLWRQGDGRQGDGE